MAGISGVISSPPHRVGPNWRLIQLAEPAERNRYAPAAVTLVYASASEYFDLLFGNAQTAYAELTHWCNCEDSQFALRDATVALDGDQCAGLFLAFGGAEVSKRRWADIKRLLKRVKTSAILQQRLQRLRHAAPPIQPWQYYLRALAVAGPYRSRGIGARLLDAYVQKGLEAGFQTFRLDVYARNATARRLYIDAGFHTVCESTETPEQSDTVAMQMEIEAGRSSGSTI